MPGVLTQTAVVNCCVYSLQVTGKDRHMCGNVYIVYRYNSVLNMTQLEEKLYEWLMCTVSSAYDVFYCYL